MKSNDFVQSLLALVKLFGPRWVLDRYLQLTTKSTYKASYIYAKLWDYTVHVLVTSTVNTYSNVLTYHDTCRLFLHRLMKVSVLHAGEGLSLYHQLQLRAENTWGGRRPPSPTSSTSSLTSFHTCKTSPTWLPNFNWSFYIHTWELGGS